MVVRVVVLARSVKDLPARMAALDLDRGVSDREPLADPALEVAHDMLCITQRVFFEHDVGAQRHLLG